MLIVNGSASPIGSGLDSGIEAKEGISVSKSVQSTKGFSYAGIIF